MEIDEIYQLEQNPNTILRVLAKSWLDAHEHRSVKQNIGQRKALIESAIKQTQKLLN